MSFLDEVDGLKAKLGIGHLNPFMLVGICIVALLVVFAIGVLILQGFTTPGVVVEHQGNQVEGVSDDAEESNSLKTICVHVAGEVSKPGMYELRDGARVSDAVDAAGGMLDSADQLSVNLARQVSDGEQIIVMSRDANEQSVNDGGKGDTAASGANVESQPQQAASGKVNINTAGVSELTSLDGVGDATAQKIIAYRQANGSFSSIEEIKKVSGIGDKKFEAIKDRITV